MAEREQDDLPYRSPVHTPGVKSVVSKNEQEYSTLKIVRSTLAATVEGLYKEFNAFEVLKNADAEMAASNLLRQVEVKQGVYDIVSPLLEAVDNAMRVVDDKYKE